jgi:release factor glutamine methyltransferase
MPNHRLAKNVKNLLERAAWILADLPNGRRDAELLLMRAAGRDRAWLLSHPEVELTPDQNLEFEDWLARRARYEPIQYILGETEFYGLTFKVTSHVLIPRPETEHLVEAALERVPPDASIRICDVGSGSGAIAVTLAHKLPLAHVVALDISPAALAIAKQNAETHGVADRIRLIESDLLSAVAGETFQLIVSNPPYVPSHEVIESQVRDYEPHTALFAGPTGLEIYQRLIPAAREALASDGWLLMEIGHGQRDALAALLADWNRLEFLTDLQGIPRVAIAQRPA